MSIHFSRYLAPAAAAAMLLAACDQSSNIGQSLVDESIDIIIDSAFTVTGHSVANNSVQSRTLTQLLGDIDIDGFGTVSSYFVTQFMPAANIETDGVTSIDSLKLVMRVPKGDFIGDSIAPMGLTVYQLDCDLPYPIYSDTPLQSYFDSSKPVGTAIYTMANFRLDSLSSSENSTYREFSIPLDVEIGRKLFNGYKANPAAFADPEVFTTSIFKGLAVCNTFGSGRLTRIGQSLLRLYYTRRFYSEELQRDSVQNLSGNYFGVTPEVITNNLIDYTPTQAILDKVAAGSAIAAAPAAYEVQLRFPTPEILNRYNSERGDLSMINSLSMRLPVTAIDNDANIQPPTNVLLILAKEKDDFFKGNLLPDNIHSFYATYDATNYCYIFSDMLAYINEMAQKDSLEESDYTFIITPVTVTSTSSGSGYYQTTVVGSVTPEVSTAAAAELLLDEAKIIFAFSKQSLNIY